MEFLNMTTTSIEKRNKNKKQTTESSIDQNEEIKLALVKICDTSTNLV